MRKTIIILISIITFITFFTLNFAFADQDLAQKLSGRILLQVESRGEAWYVNPTDQKRYYLNRPSDAFDLMRNLSIGITNKNLAKIPIGLIKEAKPPKVSLASDDDKDGLPDNLEKVLGTNPQSSDSDNDGYDDKTEIEHNYDPLGSGKINIDENFTKQHSGKIFLQTEKNGETWYVNPTDQKRYYLGRPTDAFDIMRSLSLGITNENLNKIITGYLNITPPSCSDCQPNQSNDNADQVFAAAANAIMTGKTSEAMSYFTPEMQKAVEYTMNFLDDEGKFILGNIMSGAKLSSSTETQKTYSTEVYFSLGGYKVPVNFYIKKQPDETWLLTNL